MKFYEDKQTGKFRFDIKSEYGTIGTLKTLLIESYYDKKGSC